jgi:hypothetical protein
MTNSNRNPIELETFRLSYWEGYVSMYLFLDKLFTGRKNEDFFIQIISMMSPHRPHLSSSKNKTMLIDWICVFKEKDLLKEEVEVEECYRLMLKYLDMEAKKCGFNHDAVLKKLSDVCNRKNNSSIWSHWINCCLVAKV